MFPTTSKIFEHFEFINKVNGICKSSDDHLNNMLLKLKAIDKVFISNFARCRSVIEGMKRDSHNKLQIIADFDRTISSFFNKKGTHEVTSYKVLTNYKDEVYKLKEKEKVLTDKYIVYEFNKNLSHQEKLPYMIDWYNLTFDLIVESKITKNEVHEAAKTSEITLRDGFVELIERTLDLEIPFTVASAGIGDIIQGVISRHINNSNKVKICSNFFIYHENGTIMDYTRPLINSYNKNLLYVNEKSLFDQHMHRKNVIIFGDSLGDVDVIRDVPYELVTLKIGFLNFEVDDHLESYLNVYDIVVTDPTSLTILNPLFEYILETEIR